MASQPGQLAVTGGSGLMLPPPPRPPKRKEAVLEEDEWTATLEAIIERDFFPELPKLESKIAWLQAIRSGDPEQIRQAQLLIAQRRAAAGGAAAARPFTGATPAGAPLFTPGGTAARALAGDTPYIPVLPPGMPATQLRRPATGGMMAGDGDVEAAADVGAGAAPPMSLDQFMAAHTSEDNASFQQIMEDVNKRRRLRAAAQLEAQPDPKLLITDGREKTDGFGTTGQQPSTLIGWRFEPKNAFYYDSATRDVVSFSEAELAAQVQGPPKAINHGATRFPNHLAPSASATPTSSSAGGGSVAGGSGAGAGAAAVGARAAGDGTRGYDILATPAFDPGVEETPFMTWGDIEATPLRIEAEDLPPGPYMEGPSFFIKEGSRKEQKGHALASRAAAALRRKKDGLRGGTPLVTSTLAAAAAARRQATGHATGTAAAAQPASGRPPTLAEQLRAQASQRKPLSDAARRLASSLGRKTPRPDTDLALRASYRAPTPGMAAAGAARHARGATPAASIASGGGGWSAAPTPQRGGAGGGGGGGGATPSVQATLEEEELRVQALMKQRQLEEQQRQEQEAARVAARQAFQQQQQQQQLAQPMQQQQQQAPHGGVAAAPPAGSELTSGLLTI